MGADPDAIAKELEAIAPYKEAFERELGGPPTGDRIVKALATFVRTIHAGDTPFDRLDSKKRDNTPAGRGFLVFSKVAQCTLCHLPPTFSDGLFHNVGVGMDKEKPDAGRGKILADAAVKASQPAPPDAEKLQGAFKTPTLRGAALSGPYFHDGSVAVFDEAVEAMIKGGKPNPHLDEKLKPANLTPKQRADLFTFLKSLTPDNKPYPRPNLPQ
jgi:cytochrome c peroxidase